MKKHPLNPFAALYALGRQRLTPKSERNIEIEQNQASLNPLYCPVGFQRGGGKFYSREMIANLRHAEMVMNSEAKRCGSKPRPLFYGDA